MLRVIPHRQRARRAPSILVAVFTIAATAPAAAESVRVGPATELRSVEFEFVHGRSFAPDELQKQMGQQPQVTHTTLRGAFDFLPFIEPVVPHPCDPLELQRDVVRLREFYRRSGFPNPDVRYVVTADPKRDAVKVRFLVTEGRGIVLRVLRINGTDGLAFGTTLPAELQRQWLRFTADLNQRCGKRFGAVEKRSIEAAVLEWLRNRGYAFASVSSESGLDLDAHTAELDLRAAPGPRARVAGIEVTGTSSVNDEVVRKTLPFTAGDWYSARQIADGQRALVNLGLFHLAVVDLPKQPADSTVQIRTRVEEGKSRLLTGEFGYSSDAGLTLGSDWMHRNFRGGARTLTFSAVGQTGIWAIEDDPERLLRGSVSLNQPGVLYRRLSLVTSPFAQYRDDFRDRSWEYGINTTFVYLDQGWVRSMSLQYSLSWKRVLEYRTGSGGSDDIFTLLEAAIDSLGAVTPRSAFTLAATFGTQDHPVKPRRLLLFRPSLEATAPSKLNTAEYTRFDLTTNVQRPLGERSAFWGRLAAGRIFPFGKSTQANDDVEALTRYIEIRDYLFTVGGSGDVRGWNSRLLGPKIPDLQVSTGADSGQLRADRYVPVGGNARIAASVELRLPIPFLGPAWGTHVFLDGGKVWSVDSHYIGASDFDQQRFFFATGFGIDRDTPVGPLRLSLAYKLNPSQLDVLKPQEFLDALTFGTLDTVHTSWNRRLLLHLAIGSGF